VHTSLGVATVSCALLLSGCAGVPTTTNTTQSNAVQGTTLRGMVHGGQSPISGAHVYLYAMPNNGYYGGPGIAPSGNNASISLLTSSVLSQNPAGGQDGNGNYYVTTDPGGNFTITNEYTCPTAYEQTYLYAVGGNPGLAAGTNNTAATLLAPVDACNTSSYRVINEVSTIAAVYAFAGFITDPTHVSSSGSALAQTALNNATGTMTNLYTPSTGVANTTTAGGNGKVPQAEINTLANILAACVNSTGPTSSACATLFANAMNGSTAPSDTATAAINIAHNPGENTAETNIAALYGLQTASSPFQPDLSSTPWDFSIAIVYTGGGLDICNGLAIDAAGNVWVTNGNGNSVSEFSPVGVPNTNSPFTVGGLTHPSSLAIDSSGNVWVANPTANTISVLNSSGSAVNGSPISGVSEPEGIAVDKSGNVWVANYSASSISKFNSGGSPANGSPFSGGGLDHPYGIAIDTLGNVWAASPNFNIVSELSSNGSPVSTTGYTSGGLTVPLWIAIDASNNAWVDNEDGGSSGFYVVYNSSGTAISGASGYTGGGLDEPGPVAIDGSGNVWAPNLSGDLSEFNSSGAPISLYEGYGYCNSFYGCSQGVLANPSDVAIDGSGNAWVSNSYYGTNSITEFVGVASPVVTPLVANLMSPYGQHAVNKP